MIWTEDLVLTITFCSTIFDNYASLTFFYFHGLSCFVNFVLTYDCLEGTTSCHFNTNPYAPQIKVLKFLKKLKLRPDNQH